MSRIYHSITELIGNTPLVELRNFSAARGLQAPLLVKVEAFNPLSSAKDRVAAAMVREGMASGRIGKDTLLVEPTSGNTGVGLAFVAATLGLRLILTMPETMSVERQRLVRALGAEIVLTEGARGMQGAVDKAEELAAQHPDSFIPQQFENPANPKAHYETTGPELFRDTDGELAAFVAGIGTGGTITGAGRYLKEHIPGIRIAAVEPDASPLLSGGKAGPHKIQGIGANFVPGVLDQSVYDEIIRVTNEDAIRAAREAARMDGVLCGISSGAAIHAAAELAARPEFAGRRVAAFLPDTGERYLSTGIYD